MTITNVDPDEPGAGFRVGGETAEYCDVRVLSRSAAADYWDGNWLVCLIEVAAGGFRGRIQANLRVEELVRFSGELARLHDALKGEARLATTEDQVDLILRGDGRGHIACVGRVQDASAGNTLAFTLDTDQTHLPGTGAQLQAVLRRYPLRGEAPGRPAD